MHKMCISWFHMFSRLRVDKALFILNFIDCVFIFPFHFFPSKRESMFYLKLLFLLKEMELKEIPQDDQIELLDLIRKALGKKFDIKMSPLRFYNDLSIGTLFLFSDVYISLVDSNYAVLELKDEKLFVSVSLWTEFSLSFDSRVRSEDEE